METGEWISQNWFNIVVAVCSLGGLWFSAFTIRQNTQAQREETKAQKSSNLLAITANHREVWKEFFGKPELARVIEPSADVRKLPITAAEEFFVNMVISHTSSVYETLKDDLLVKQENLRRDVKSFFSLPVPKAVWTKTKLLQNQDFAAFIDSSLR
jgi:hypothetical protein